jgi:hypothetical protein
MLGGGGGGKGGMHRVGCIRGWELYIGLGGPDISITPPPHMEGRSQEPWLIYSRELSIYRDIYRYHLLGSTSSHT